MKFDLDVIYYDDTEDGVLAAQHTNVDVTWTDNDCHDATARNDAGETIATLHTFDDYPIEIFEDYIEIDGYAKTATSNCQYGRWVLKTK